MTVSLDFIAVQLQRVLDGQSKIDSRLAAMEARMASLETKVDQHTDENTVLTGLVMRYAGEHIAWGGMQNELRKLRERLDEVERRLS